MNQRPRKILAAAVTCAMALLFLGGQPANAGFCPGFCEGGDETAPDVTSMSVTPNPVNLDEGPVEVTVKAHVTDEVGVETVQVFLASKQSEQNTLGAFPTYSSGEMVRVSGDAQSGDYEYTVTLPALSIGGPWYALVNPHDAAGNSRSQTRSFDVLNEDPDADIPEVVSASVTPNPVDVSDGPADITVTVRIKDRAGFPGFYGFGAYEQASGQSAGTSDVQRISGDAHDGTYQGTITIPEGARSGQWSVSIGNLRDVLGNLSYGKDLPFIVTNGTDEPDLSGPVVSWDPLTPSIVDASAGPVTLTSRLRVSDPSGVDPSFRLTSFSYGGGPDIDFTVPELISGDQYDGVYEATITIDSTEPGGRRIAYLPEVFDLAGNNGYQSSSQLVQIKAPVLVNQTRPSISGLAANGGRLTAAGDTWSAGDVRRSYRWKRDGTTITGATADTYGLTDADSGHQITVVVTAGADGFTPATATSDPTASVIAAKITNTAPPAISGTPTVGSTLTSSTGTFTPSPVTRTYQWMRGDEEIAAATARTYRVTAADVGFTLTVKVTAARTGLAPLTVESAPTPAIPENLITTTAPPAITGTPTAGSALTTSTGTFNPSTVSRTYQWNRDGTPITGATARTYRGTTADVGSHLTVTLTVTKANYTTLVVTTDPTAEIALNTITNTALPRISGTPAVGRTLSSSAGSWSPSVTKAYQWNRNGVPVSSATTNRYVLTAADAGTSITVTVTATKTNYAPTAATSAPLAIP